MTQTRHTASHRKKNHLKTKTLRESAIDTLDFDIEEGNTPFFDDELLTLDEFESLSSRSKPKEGKPVSNRQRIDPPARSMSPRKKVVRRRQIDPSTCERDYSADEVEFMNALSEYKRSSGRMFPTCSEILEVLKDLGYEKCVRLSAPEVVDLEENE